jgi:hypothetical protein
MHGTSLLFFMIFLIKGEAMFSIELTELEKQVIKNALVFIKNSNEKIPEKTVSELIQKFKD